MNKFLKVASRTALALNIATVFSGSVAAKDLTLGYVVASLKIPFNVATKKGFEDAAREAGVTTIVIDPEGSIPRQTAAIDELIAKGVDGIGFLPMDSVLAATYADKSLAQKVPSVSVAVQVGDSTTRNLRDVYPSLSALVTTDDVAIGERAGELATGLLPKDRLVKIAIIEGAHGYSAVPQRTQGFRAALDKAGVDYRIAGSQPTDWTPEQGAAACQKFLSENRDLDLIFSQADPMAIGCAQALRSSGSTVKLVATGGGSLEGNDAIAKGDIDGSVCTRPELLGRLMLKVLYEAATNPGAQKAQLVTYDSALITKETLQNCPPEW
ncbi:sugar ABC transporter substrate-binding protein [Rhizobium leguminosarum]|uniref:sugar ABC transporter substrate-binding protein n=1 Tax=Rhizobium leguminosarum TaxID=384 RepID=UPI000FF20B99|nr:sugar ABC transporter substrate-binding protein [Rhizobium leguminosarum]RWY79952.1 sugar ABC transporter substrate-binding protein [Rhizobium leguminosarum]